MFLLNLSMQKKLIIVFVFLIILPILLANYIAYLNYTRHIQSNSTEYVSEVAAKMLNKMEDYVEDMKRITIVTQYATELQDYLRRPELSLERNRKIDFYIQLMNNMKKDTHSVYIFDNYGNMFYNNKTMGFRTNINESMAMWKKALANEDGRAILVSTQKVLGNSAQTFYLFSVVKEIIDITSMTPIGMIVVDANISIIEEAVRDLDRVTKGKTFIIDENDNVIYDSDRKLISRNVADEEAVKRTVLDSGSFQLNIDGEPYIYTYKVSGKLGWKAIVYIPLKDLRQGAVITRNATLLATFLIIVTALLISIVISFALTKPLRKLTELMKAVQNGQLNVSFNVKFRDEVGTLGRNFNLMLLRIKSLIEEIYLMQSRKNRAELEALQSQINPHFMYNTLETIRMTALLNDDAEVSSMATILGQMLRYGINRGDETVTIRDEMEHLRNYMTLQNFRFDERFTLVDEVDGDVLDYPVIKLILQPIVENAIFHGLEEKEDEGVITIRSMREPDCLAIVIADNGVGMPADTLRRLAESIEPHSVPEPSRTGIGLRNVNVRLKLSYGEQYGLRIESEEGAGTRVKLLLPLERR